ncbi:MAG: aminotransferase class I/II-fold pyridoxal phosphate-dependent enzyme [Thermoleophilia bacterium]
MARIYLSPPHPSGREIEFVEDAISSNWLAPLGPHVDAFEQEFIDVVGVPNALALSSGTAALHLSLVVLGIGVGDEVICSSLTFAASANAIRYTGAATVFVDCDTASWTMDPDLLDEALTDRRRHGGRVRAVLAVDLYGQCCDYGALRAVCDQHEVLLLQDAAESLGATYGGQASGSQGMLASFSFNGNKIITTSGGGMLVSADRELIEHARKLSTQARDAAPHYEHSELGFNYRLSNVLAALGRAQLIALPDRVAARRAVNAQYREHLGDEPGITFMPEAPYGTSNHWLTCILVEPEVFGTDREAIRVALEALDIEARPVWKPMHLQPFFAGDPSYGGDVSARLFEQGLCLPSGSALSVDDQARVVAGLRGTARRTR